MFVLKYNLLFILILIFSLIMVLASNSFYFMWIFMELNLMVFLVFMVINSNLIGMSPMKYFLVNGFCSVVFIFFITLDLINLKNDYIFIILNLVLLMKLGLIPFHFWFIDLMTNLTWFLGFLLSTMQKIIPFLILSYLFDFKILMLFILFGGLMGLMLNFNQVLLKKIMAYSSINHMYWMLMSLTININLWLFYFFNYVLVNIPLFYLFNKFNMNQIMDLYLLFMFKKVKIKSYILFMMLSLGGLPPFYGFMLKWYILIYLICWWYDFVLIFLIIYSLIFLYFYMRVMYNSMIMNFMSLKLNMNFNFYSLNFSFFYILILLSIMNFMMFLFWMLY